MRVDRAPTRILSFPCLLLPTGDFKISHSDGRHISRGLSVILFLLLPGSVFSDHSPDTLQLELARAVFLESSGALNLSGLTLSADGWLYFCDDNGPAPPDWKLDNPVILRVRIDSVINPAATFPELEAIAPASGSEAFASLAGKARKVL